MFLIDVKQEKEVPKIVFLLNVCIVFMYNINHTNIHIHIYYVHCTFINMHAYTVTRSKRSIHLSLCRIKSDN